MMAAVVTETFIDLVRHGEVEGGARLRGSRSDDPLTPRGWQQLQQTLAGVDGWDLVVTSTLQRCRAFATALGGERGAACRIEPRFDEYDFGRWDGRAFDELWQAEGDRLAAFFGDPDAVIPPGGEAAEAFRSRVRAGWAELIEQQAGSRVLVVGHGGVLRQIVADVLGAGSNLHAALEWPHAGRSRIRVVHAPPDPPSSALVVHGVGPVRAG